MYGRARVGRRMTNVRWWNDEVARAVERKSGVKSSYDSLKEGKKKRSEKFGCQRKREANEDRREDE